MCERCFELNSSAWKLNRDKSRKDTDDGGGEDGENGSNWDGALGILQISRPVGTSHDS